MIDEEKIGYIGSMVLGLNDALVELTGALAGFTFTLQNTRLIGAAGLVTGIAASLSMSASEYLSQKSEKGKKNPVKASFYTGIAYILTVLILIFPYFAFTNYYIALGITVLEAILVVLVFTFFISVVKELSFRKMFLEILFISLGVAAVSFMIGWATKQVLNIEV
jgi:VIT1/CCC1 family predicted Fe2+/Mn2+ transporter